MANALTVNGPFGRLIDRLLATTIHTAGPVLGGAAPCTSRLPERKKQ
jgi:hypothetical protein